MANTSDKNAQGAPTEGLGQTVTFAFEPGKAVARDDNNLGNGERVGEQSRVFGVQKAAGVAVERDELFDLVLRAGGAAGARIAKREKEEAFARGMQQAATGKAITEIANEQPWYTRIFGETDAVEGARQFEIKKRTAEFAAGVETDMQELRKLGQDDIRKELMSRLDKTASTGDKLTDAMLSSDLLTRMPALFKAQAKEHYGYQQEVARHNEAASFQAQASGIQALAQRLAKDPDSPSAAEEFQNAKRGFIATIVPPAGRDEDDWQQTLTGNLRSTLQQGNLFAYYAVTDKIDGNESILGALKPDQRASIEAAARAAENGVRQNYGYRYAARMGEVESLFDPLAGVPLEKAKEQLHAVDNHYRANTGAREGLWSAAQIANLVEGNIKGVRHLEAMEAKANYRERAQAAAAAQTDADKAAAKQAMDQAILTATRNRNLAPLMSERDGTEYAKPADVVSVVSKEYRRMLDTGNVAQAQDYLGGLWATGMTLPLVEDRARMPLLELDRANSNAASPGAAQQAALQWEYVRGAVGDEGAEKYFGPFARAAKFAYDSGAHRSEDVAKAIGPAMMDVHRQGLPKVTDKEAKAFAEYMTKKSDGWATRTFDRMNPFSDAMKISNMQEVTPVAERVMARLKAVGVEGEALHDATRRALFIGPDREFDWVGTSAIRRDKGQESLVSYLQSTAVEQYGMKPLAASAASTAKNDKGNRRAQGEVDIDLAKRLSEVVDVAQKRALAQRNMPNGRVTGMVEARFEGKPAVLLRVVDEDGTPTAIPVPYSEFAKALNPNEVGVAGKINR